MILIIMAMLHQKMIHQLKINIALLLTIAHGEHVEFMILTRSEKKKNLIHQKKKKTLNNHIWFNNIICFCAVHTRSLNPASIVFSSSPFSR